VWFELERPGPRLGTAKSPTADPAARADQPRRYFQTAIGSDTSTIAAAHSSERVT
jgi:hypothetical protein